MPRVARIVGLVALAGILAGCESGPQQQARYEEKLRQITTDTKGWVASAGEDKKVMVYVVPAGQRGPRGPADDPRVKALDDTIRASVDNALRAKGYDPSVPSHDSWYLYALSRPGAGGFIGTLVVTPEVWWAHTVLVDTTGSVVSRGENSIEALEVTVGVQDREGKVVMPLGATSQYTRAKRQVAQRNLPDDWVFKQRRTEITYVFTESEQDFLTRAISAALAPLPTLPAPRESAAPVAAAATTGAGALGAGREVWRTVAIRLVSEALEALPHYGTGQRMRMSGDYHGVYKGGMAGGFVLRVLEDGRFSALVFDPSFLATKMDGVVQADGELAAGGRVGPFSVHFDGVLVRDGDAVTGSGSWTSESGAKGTWQTRPGTLDPESVVDGLTAWMAEVSPAS